MRALLLDLKLFLFLTFLSLLVFLFDNLGFLNFPKSALQILTVPVQYGLYQGKISLSKQLEFISLARFSAQENKALRTQLAQLLVENSNLQVKLKETESLIDTYNKLNPKTYDLLPARIISFNRLLLIDKGSNDEVSVGQAVVFKDTYLGQIKRVGPKVSEVLLVQDPDSKIAVFSQNNQGSTRGVLYGQFGSELLMDKIMHQETIEKDDLIYSEGVEGKFPKGLIMGKVSQVLERQNEVFKQAKVKPIFNIVDLDIVFVIKNP